ncbi:hypothetical protein MNBD_CPR01-419 [hydrothermal vent metagenome]|uniref:Uncharacterized protein n=1 Tax=hydrothermal vent metagenome TaxID=652676 RepID=A0A3B0V2W0_9ZZZZ
MDFLSARICKSLDFFNEIGFVKRVGMESVFDPNEKFIAGKEVDGVLVYRITPRFERIFLRNNSPYLHTAETLCVNKVFDNTHSECIIERLCQRNRLPSIGSLWNLIKEASSNGYRDMFTEAVNMAYCESGDEICVAIATWFELPGHEAGWIFDAREINPRKDICPHGSMILSVLR